MAFQKLTEAEQNFKKRLVLEEKGKMSSRVTYLQLGDCYQAMAQAKPHQKKAYLLQSRRYYEKVLDIAIHDNNKSLMAEGYLSLSGLDKKMGRYQDAYENFEHYVAYRDSINGEEANKKALQARMQYDFDKKENQAKLEQQRKDFEVARTRNLLYALSGLILSIALFLLWNNRQKQCANAALAQEKKTVEATLQELKATQSQLIQSEKMASLGELTAGIAHEIQNPLNFVNNFSEVSIEMVTEIDDERAKDQESRDDELVSEILSDIKQNLEKINHHGKRADAIVKGMLQHSRVSTGTKEATDLNVLCEEYLRLSYHGLRAKDKSFNATFTSDFDETIGKIDVVPQDLGRVILNILTNAFYAVNEKKQANPEGYQPTVSIGTKKNKNTVEIKITDNGNGIPQSHIDKIFQPFFTTKPTGQGTGLGLSLSYDIVKAHGGELAVQSKQGEGSVFTIKLPVQ